ncbi:MAG: chemotaxis protein CheX [Clostridiales bacterium]|nr:chemotaxis protein CheX [Clostridiales bacterium]
MAEIKAEHINPFLMAATQVLSQMALADTTIGKPYIRETKFTHDAFIIIIGVTGEMKGQVMIVMSNEIACEIASKMCMMTIMEMDELATSALSELGNMIMGNTATIFSTKGIGIDITPPTICTGDVQFMSSYVKNICVPLVYDGGKTIEINLAIKQV